MPFTVKDKRHLFEIKQVIWDALIQAEDRVAFCLGDKGSGYLSEMEGGQLHQQKEGISIRYNVMILI